MNIKTYTWVKYLATFGSILLLVNPLLVLLKTIKSNFFIHNWTTLSQVTITLYVVSVVFFAFYFWLRLILIKKSGYQYTKKDQFYLMLSLGLYSLAILLGGLNLIVGLILQDQNQTLTSTFFGISFALIIIGVVGGAINESLSRIQEQIQLYQKQNQEINKAKKAKRDQLLNNEISETEIQAEVVGQRTTAAQNLLKRDQSKQKSRSKTTKIEPKTIVATDQEYNPFLDSELNQELKNDPQFNEWLKNQKKSED